MFEELGFPLFRLVWDLFILLRLSVYICFTVYERFACLYVHPTHAWCPLRSKKGV